MKMTSVLERIRAKSVYPYLRQGRVAFLGNVTEKQKEWLSQHEKEFLACLRSREPDMIELTAIPLDALPDSIKDPVLAAIRNRFS